MFTESFREPGGSRSPVLVCRTPNRGVEYRCFVRLQRPFLFGGIDLAQIIDADRSLAPAPGSCAVWDADCRQ